MARPYTTHGSGERPGAREAIDRTAQRLVRESRKPGNTPLTHDEARRRVIDGPAKRRDRKER